MGVLGLVLLPQITENAEANQSVANSQKSTTML